MLVFAAAKVAIFFEIKKGNREIVYQQKMRTFAVQRASPWTPIFSENKSTVYQAKSFTKFLFLSRK